MLLLSLAFVGLYVLAMVLLARARRRLIESCNRMDAILSRYDQETLNV